MRKIMAIGIAVLMVLMAFVVMGGGAAAAEDYVWSADIKLTNDGCSSNQALAVGPDDTIHVVFARDTGSPPSGDDYEDTIYYMKSTDGGVTWSTMIPISYAGLQVPSQSAQVPAIAVDSTGKIHVVWHGTDPLNPPPGKNIQAMLGYISSSDGGATWTTPVNLNPRLGENKGAGHPRIQVDASNNLYIVWDTAGTGIGLAKSTDSGSTWTTMWLQGVGGSFNPSLACHKPDIAVGPGGDLHVTYVANGGNLGDIYYRASTDGGTTWTSPAQKIYTATTPDGYHFATIEVNSGGTIQVVTRDNFVGDGGTLGSLYYLEKPSAGVWSSPVEIISGQTRYYWGGWREEMVLDSNDNLYLVCSLLTLGEPYNRDVYLKVYDKVSNTWLVKERLTTAADTQGNPHAGIDSSGNLHVSYLDYSESDIHYLSRKLATARDYKQDAIAELEAAKTDDDKIDKKLDKVIKNIEKSLKDDRWIDVNHIDEKKGNKVFDDEKAAVIELMKLSDKDDTPQDVKDTCQAVIEEKLMKADEILATTVYEEAKAGAGDPKVDKELEKCAQELAKADEEIAKGKYDKAVDHYKKAWEHAQNALKHTP